MCSYWELNLVEPRVALPLSYDNQTIRSPHAQTSMYIPSTKFWQHMLGGAATFATEAVCIPPVKYKGNKHSHTDTSCKGAINAQIKPIEGWEAGGCLVVVGQWQNTGTSN